MPVMPQAPKPRDEFAAYCAELLASLGPIRIKRMFSGHGIYADDLFVALIIQDRLYLKTAPNSLAKFQQAGCQPFVYEARGKTMSISYYEPPSDAMESPELMRPWARLAMQAALQAKLSAKPAKKAGKPAGVKATKPAPPRKSPATKA